MTAPKIQSAPSSEMRSSLNLLAIESIVRGVCGDVVGAGVAVGLASGAATDWLGAGVTDGVGEDVVVTVGDGCATCAAVSHGGGGRNGSRHSGASIVIAGSARCPITAAVHAA